MSEIVPVLENFPALVGNIEQDTATLVGELKVGDVVVERGWARLYLIWASRLYLESKYYTYKCSVCEVYVAEVDSNKPCPRCGNEIISEESLVFPTLESYVTYIAEETGKSRQTLFNRLSTYRSLCDDRGVEPGRIFALNLLSPGAASKLAKADVEDPNVKLVGDSWAETVEAALSFPSKSEALRFVKHEVLNEPKISAQFMTDKQIKIFKEYSIEDEPLVIDDFQLTLNGEWPEDMLQWISSKLNAKR